MYLKIICKSPLVMFIMFIDRILSAIGCSVTFAKSISQFV